MWALLRAAHPLRSQSCRIMVACTCCTKTDILNGNAEFEVHDANNLILEGCFLPKPYTCESSISLRSSLWSRNLSSHAGAKSSDNEDKLEDSFSGLETPPKSGKTKNVVKEEDGEVESEEISEEELDETIEDVLGLSDVEVESSSEKNSVKRFFSPLFETLMETPRQSINSALEQWVNEGKALGRDEISLAMFHLRRRRFYGKALQFVEWLEANKQIDFSDRDYASLVDLIAKLHGLQKAETYIKKLPESSKTEMIYGALLANCVATGNVKKSEEIFNKIRDLGFPHTVFACNQLLLLYKRNNRKKIADVLKLMEKENIQPSQFTYKLLIDSKGLANDISGMEDLVERMKAEGMELDLRTHAVLTRYYILANLKEKAMAELKSIEGDDIAENRNACRELLPLYASLGKADDVARIWKVCESNPRTKECLTAIEAWGILGKIENAEEVFEYTMKTWNKLSFRFYNELLKVYANHKLLSKGKDLAKRMSENGCKIGPLTWHMLVKLYAESGEVEKADLILQKAVQQNNTRPLYSSYLVVLEKYANRGDVHNAEKIFHRLKQSGYLGRIRLYQLLLQAYVNAKVPAYGFKERMKADSMFPNKVVVEQLAAIDGFKKTQISQLLD